MRARCSGRRELHGIDTLCRFVGHCADMPAALGAADVVVVTPLQPPLAGRAAAEAQAMGRPLVTSTVGVLPENVLGAAAHEARNCAPAGWCGRAMSPRSRARIARRAHARRHRL